MDLELIAPPVIIGVGAAIGAVLLRSLADAADAARAAQRRVRRLEDALIPLRVETRAARRSVDRQTRR